MKVRSSPNCQIARRATSQRARQPVQLPRRDLEDLYVPKVDLGSYDPPNNIDSDAEKETF